jgi:ElaB/YqjD/DUF883 family membrane-anchored ribosome-binding protein
MRDRGRHRAPDPRDLPEILAAPAVRGHRPPGDKSWNLAHRQALRAPAATPLLDGPAALRRSQPGAGRAGSMEETMAEARAAFDNGRDAEELDALRSDLDTLRKDFGTLVSALRSNADSRSKAELDAMCQRLARPTDDFQTAGPRELGEVEIGERPFVNLAIAFATGLVVGRIFDRR